LSLVGAFFNENEGSILFEAADAMLTPEKIQTASDLQLYQWLTGIISALNYLHKKAIAHGNLTLSTIMLCDGQIKLTSFTYASLQATTMNQLNKLSIEKFSANLAPELINGQCEEPTPKSDIYSFGKLLETFFTGRRKELITLQQQCIDSDPAKRPNAADLLLQLINFERPLKMKQANDIYENGRRAEAAKNFLLAAQHYQSAAELGSTKALTNIATFYREGQAGLPTDLQKAFELTHIAAQSGHTRAMQNLAAHYQQGIGVTQDTEKANYWLQRKKRLENAPN
jgi:TPR repeat protein